MTTLYKPVLIESAEQAEALPDGTLALKPDGEPAEAIRDRLGRCWHDMGGTTSDDDETIGWTALLPIEAEEEFTAMGTDYGEPWIAHVGHDGIDGSREEAQRYVGRFGGFIARRLVTPWEEA